MTLNECLQHAQSWSELINNQSSNPYECYLEATSWLYCALSLASEDERKWVIDCMCVVTMMVSLKEMRRAFKPREATFESDEFYHFQYRGLNEPDKIKRR